MTPEIRLATTDLSGGYVRDEPAITGVTMAAAAGTIVAVLGPNGGGKTTLFRALLGQLPHVMGKIELEGSAAYVPQTERARLDFPVNALDVALMGTYGRVPWYRPVGRAEKAVAREALEQVGLADHAGAAFGSLSGGQRQRVLIARALAQKAQVLLLDEPLSGVDSTSAARVLEVLFDLRNAGRTLLVATHDIHQARAFDTVLCLNHRQVAFGPPGEVLEPAALAETYGGELIVLEDGRSALTIQHHGH
jgi:manganese/iron transport system ATP-binding protein/manganese/zinc/iron transport system ATP- binding protein